MRIAFDATVVHGRKSGVGYYCEELLKAMVSMDHDTEFFVFSHQPVRLDLPAANGNVRVANSKFFPIRAFYLHALLPGLLSAEKPSLCHYTNFLAPVIGNTPYVVTIHDMGLERLKYAHPLAKRLYTRRLIPRIAERARLIVTNSEYSKWEIVRYLGISEDRIRVTPLGVSPEFQPIAQRDLGGVLKKYNLYAPYFLYVGNLEPRKNLNRLVEAFAGLRDKEHQLVIVGNRWYRGNDVEAAAARLGLRDRVRLLGYVPRADLPALYSGSTAFVYPSLLEGFGLPVIEAMSCGVPVVTSNNSSLKEIAGDAALLIDPSNNEAIRAALTNLIEDESLRASLKSRGLERARRYSWDHTASLTLDIYREAADASGSPKPHAEATVPSNKSELARAVRHSVEYSAMFQYPLRLKELHERLEDIHIDVSSLDQCCNDLKLPRVGDFIALDSDFVSMRHFRETVSDRAIEEVWPHLQTIASFPFVRMMAFSGATAHRNMVNGEDIDLFVVIEDGKLWAAFLMMMLWAKWKGLRRRLCINYVISDRALPLFDRDVFTAHQVTALKPIFGKATYDEFMRMNSFVARRFPNFSPKPHRAAYPEIQTSLFKKVAEVALGLGPIQLVERFSRRFLGDYLRGKAQKAAAGSEGDILLEPRRLKLHMNSHRQSVLSAINSGSGV